MSYTITLVNSSQNIGDSLSTINQSYSSLSQWVIDTQDSYDKKWKYVYDFYIKYVEKLDLTLNLVHTLSTKWDDFQSTVETNSAKWLEQPFTIFYPNILQSPFVDSYTNKVKSWLNTSFPIRDSNGNLNYVEGQRFIVNCHTYSIQNNAVNYDKNLSDLTTCYTRNSTIYVYCSDIWENLTAYCSNGNADCSYTRSCSKSKESDCYYLSPYLKSQTDFTPIGTVNTHAQYGVGRITAHVTANYTERYEVSFVKSVCFKVLECQWVFDKFIT